MIKRLVEETPAINIKDVQDLQQGKYKGTLDNNEFYIFMLGEWIQIKYAYQDEPIEITVQITSTNVGYGIRKWFCCPSCSKNTARLYLVYGAFACRECHSLIYHSSNLQGNDLAYMRWQARNAVKKLQVSDILDFPMYKPKNMHQKTFDRLRNELETLKIQHDNRWLELCSFYLGNR